MALLAKRATAEWMVEASGSEQRVRGRARRGAEAGRTALLRPCHAPGRHGGNPSAGGSDSPTAYRAWARSFAHGIGSRRAIVIVEPDAIPQAIVQSCLSQAAKAERYALIAYAVKTFARLPHTAVYIDAGNPGWVRPPTGLVAPLRASGIARADGFALNVSNFYSTKKVISYGRVLSRHLHGAHFVIDTSRNGNGATLEDDAGGPKWCNPPGRAIGHSPTTRTGRRKVDAYLWVKTPGASDGPCRAGAPPAGHWWPDYALALVRTRSSALLDSHAGAERHEHGAGGALHPAAQAAAHDPGLGPADHHRQRRVPGEVEDHDQRRHQQRGRQDRDARVDELREQRDEEHRQLGVGDRGDHPGAEGAAAPLRQLGGRAAAQRLHPEPDQRGRADQLQRHERRLRRRHQRGYAEHRQQRPGDHADLVAGNGQHAGPPAVAQ